jgi:23S rRNA (uracil1939-C5)-methyltransferase
MDKRRRRPGRGAAGGQFSSKPKGAPPRTPNRTRVAQPSRIEEVTVHAIAAGGDGVARVDGMAAFIPRSAPGDVAQVSLVSHGRFARGHLVSLTSASPQRVTPQCHHYVEDHCGGCQLQHLSIDAQRDAKAHIVRDTLLRIGKRSIDVPNVEPAPSPWDYRQKLTLTLFRNSATRRWIGGLHPLGEPDVVFALEECRISAPALVTAWRAVSDVSALLPEGSALRITFRLIPSANQVALTVAGGNTWNQWQQFVQQLPMLGALWWTPASGERVALVAPATGEQQMAANFVQVNAAMAGIMHGHVMQKVLQFQPARVVDAYAGTGGLSLDLAKQGVHVSAIEWDESAVSYLRAQLPEGSAALAAPVQDVIERAMFDPAPPDVVVLNPPRVGVDAFVTSTLNRQHANGLRGIVYVSCDPATLARDLTRLPDWRIQDVRCFDMFPQTAHVETVCVLTPEVA